MARTLSMIIYGLVDLRDDTALRDAGFERTRTDLLQRAGLPHLADELSDRSRALWPHIFDVLHGPHRWALRSDNREHYALACELPAGTIRGIEVLRFIEPAEATSLHELTDRTTGALGARAAVTSGLLVLYVEAPAAGLRAFSSRAAQQQHGAVRQAFAAIGEIQTDRLIDYGSERAEYRAMLDEHLPVILTAATGGATADATAEVGGRDVAGSTRFDACGWSVAVWTDLVCLTRADSGAAPFWLRAARPEVAVAGVGDALLMRLVQRHMLAMIAFRVAQTDASRAVELQQVAQTLRARLWWKGLSGDPLVSAVADAVADRWDVEDLAREAFEGLDAVAQRELLVRAERQTAQAVALSEQTTQLLERAAAQQALLRQQTERLGDLTEAASKQSSELVELNKSASTQSERTESFNRVAAIVAGVFVVPALIASVLGANVLPGDASVWATLAMLVLMVSSIAITQVAITVLSDDPTLSAEERQERRRTTPQQEVQGEASPEKNAADAPGDATAPDRKPLPVRERLLAGERTLLVIGGAASVVALVALVVALAA